MPAILSAVPPVVSVVVPLYQTERYIGEALGSVLAQTYPSFEVIVVDDGSRDRGPEIARAFGERDARVRVATQANRGLAGARNTGIRHARGRYVALLDADDRWSPEKLARHVVELDGNPDIAVSFSASRLVDEAGQPLGPVQRPSRRMFTAADVFCRNPVGNGSAPVIRRTALDQIAFRHPSRGDACWFDESFRQSEDIECWVRIAVQAEGSGHFAYLDEPLTDYRVSAGGLSANVEAQLATWRRFRAKVAGYAPALEADFGDLAEAYQLRYLARRAVQAGDAATAARFATTAVRLAPRIVVEEPVRTLTTLGAAYARWAVPDAAFAAIMRSAARAGLRG
jgi:glycosyltransferase involved in cell wall biosynthesis